jgi:hypothetical protein
VTREEFYKAREGAKERGEFKGRVGAKVINPFAGLLKNAREGDAYTLDQWTENYKGKVTRYAVLVNHRSNRSASRCWSFPYPVFERAVLSMLREVKPEEVLGGDTGSQDLAVLEGRLAWVEGELKNVQDSIETKGFTAFHDNLARKYEAEKTDIVAQLELARAAAALPLSDAWCEVGTLVDLLDQASDPDDVKLKLRSALRRVIDSIYLLVTTWGKERLAAVQVWFKNSPKFRHYHIVYRPPTSNGQTARKPGRWWCKSLKYHDDPGVLDFRKREDAMYYLEHGYLELFDPEHVAEIDGGLDPDVITGEIP